MKVAVLCILAFACACAGEDVRPKRSLFAYPAFYSGVGAGYYAAPLVAPYAPPLSPVVARASTVVGQPGFVARYPYSYPYEYNPYGYWPASPAVYVR